MEEKRFFIVAKFMESMISSQLDRYTIESSDSSIEELRGSSNLFNSIKNKALLGTLRKLGIKGEKKDEFKATRGDIIYSIFVEGLDKKALRDFSDYPELPKACNLIVRKHRIL